MSYGGLIPTRRLRVEYAEESYSSPLLNASACDGGD